MLIQCTKKLLDELNIKPTVGKEELPLFSWHANLIKVNRKKTIVLCNDSNRYTIVMHGLKVKDFNNIDEIIISSIRETILAESIKAEIVEQFINHSPGIIYAKTKDRSLVARMNKACDIVDRYDNTFINDVLTQIRVSMRASAYIFGDGNNNYVYPNESMYKDLEEFAKAPIFECKAVELKVTLDLENHEVERKIIVPLNITFKNLHNIIQIVFDWKDYHLHDFNIFDGDKHVVNLVSGEDAFEYPSDLPRIMETGIKLSEYVPKYSRIKYTYDFGDNWEHYIEVEKIIENHSQNYPVCLLGVGNAPPEDVGSEWGFDEFLEAISDTANPEHKSMIDWGKMQGYRDFNIELVNRRLKYSMKKGW